MLILFWVTGGGSAAGSRAQTIFPMIIGFTTMFGGQFLALQVVNWRQQGIFRRLSSTPVPLGILAISAAAAQTVMSMLQGLVVMAFGRIILGLSLALENSLLILLMLLIGGVCFNSLGALIASLSRRAENANMLYLGVLMPMFFFGGGLPPALLPEIVQTISRALPTTLLNNLLAPLVLGGFPEHARFSIVGLLAYGFIFSLLTRFIFRWE